MSPISDLHDRGETATAGIFCLTAFRSHSARLAGRDQECPLNTLRRRWLHDARRETEIRCTAARSGR